MAEPGEQRWVSHLF